MNYKSHTVLAILIFLSAILIYAQFGFNGKLARDDAIWVYGGQQMAKGIPPYVSIFDFKSPLGPMLAGGAAWIAYLTGGDDILYIRLLYFLFSCLTVVALYSWSHALFHSRIAAVLTAVVFLGFWGFSRHAGSGPQVKTVMVLFQVVALYSMAKKNWFFAGLFGGLAAWTWQPAAIFPMLFCLLAFLHKDRLRSVSKVISGAVVPSLVIVGYFLMKHAGTELCQGAVLFNMQQLQRGAPFVQHLKYMARTLFDAFPVWIYGIALGLLVIIYFYIWRYGKNDRSWLRLLRNDPFAGLLLSFPFPVLWSIRDFQGYDDFFIFLPYAATGLGLVLFWIIRGVASLWPQVNRLRLYMSIVLCVLLIVPSAWFYRQKKGEIGTYLLKQKEWAHQIETNYLHGGSLMSIGTPELMAISHRRNAHRYLYIVEGIDSLIDQETPGGFESWLQYIAETDPAVIGFKYAPGKFMDHLQNWLKLHYQESRVGDWTLYIRDR